MRIIYLHQYFNTPDMIGGTRSYEMARRLVARGHQVHMVTTWREPDGRKGWFQCEEDGINVHWQPVAYSNGMNFTARIFAFLRFALGASRYAARLEADLVFATSTPLPIAIPGIFAARRLGVPLVFEVRDLWPDVPIALGILRNPLMKWLARKLECIAYRSARRIVALAPGMKQSVVARGIDPAIVDVIPNGADLTLFYGRDVDCRQLRTNQGISQSVKLILYAGTIGDVNGVDYIVRLASRLQLLGEKYLFVIIGEGREEARIRQLASDLSVLDRSIVFLGGRPKREVSDWYHCCTASIMTYSGPEIVFRDSVSNKFFDSLAAGKPVFANFSGFSTQIAEQREAGKILPPDPADAVKVFLAYAGNDVWLASAGRRARKLAEGEFSRDKLAEDLERCLVSASGIDAP